MDGPPKHLSYSQAMMWLKCERQHYYRYAERLILPPSGALVLGGSAHRALEHQNRAKAMTGRDEPWDAVAGVYDQAFRKEAPDAVWEESPARVKDRGYKALEIYHRDVAPRVFPSCPAAVEQRLTVSLAPGLKVQMVVDVEDREGRLIDYKTTGKRIKTVSEDTVLQLSLYKLGMEKHYPDKKVSGLEAHYIIARDGGGAAVPWSVETPPAIELDRWVRSLQQIRDQIVSAYATGLFKPAPPGAWWCSAKWCGYWDQCMRDW